MTSTISRTASNEGSRDADRVAKTNSLKFRHQSALAKLMDERQDLHGVNALADLIDDSVRWSV